MTTSAQRLTAVEALITRPDGAAPAELRVECRALRGGLESGSTDRVPVRDRGPCGRRRVLTVAGRRLSGASTRKAAVYEQFVVHHAGELSPRLLASGHAVPGQVVLY